MNLLIVDDQKQVLEGIRRSISWNQIPEISEVYYASNAYEAKNYFLNWDIDILISDIEMPGENGLQLLSWVAANFPETKCILLTAHASFDYAKDALRLKAVDYILQPVPYETLKEAVVKVVQTIMQEQAERAPSKRKIFWDNFHEDAEQIILRNYFADGDLQAMSERTAQLGLSLSREAQYCLLLIDETLENSSLDSWAEGSNKSMLLSLARHFYSQLTDYLCVFELHSHHFWMLLKGQDQKEDFLTSTQSFIDFCRENYQISMTAYLGVTAPLDRQPPIYRELYQLYRNNVTYDRNLFTTGEQEPRDSAPMPATTSWASYFCKQKAELIENSLEQYIRRTVETRQMNSRTLLSLQQTFLGAFYESLHIRGIRIKNVFENEELFESYTRATRSTDLFLEFTRKVIAYNRTLDTDEEKGEASIIEAAQEYISQHLSEELSRERIAGMIHVSESYLSHLFSKETGLTLTDFITRERMALARSLLKSTSLPVQVIAVKAGYNNISYFIRSFRKCFGMTPNDYRKSTQ